MKESDRGRGRRLAWAIFALECVVLSPGGCVGHQLYNEQPEQYLQRIDASEHGGVAADLAIIEFDDHGMFWDLQQLSDTVELIERRSAESERGVFVIVFVHGWKNNADPERSRGDLAAFREQLARNAASLADDKEAPSHVVGVYLGWRGATSRLPVLESLSFWDREKAAERMVSLSMRETMYSIMQATAARPESKCFIVGHSLGGKIVGKVFSLSLASMLLAAGEGGVRVPSDFVLLLNPALDALSAWQFVDLLKRRDARLELRSLDGEVSDGSGPVMVSITSEADSATGGAYPFGRSLSNAFMAFRDDHEEPQPSQRTLANNTAGHIDFLVSHRAWVEDGEVVFERVPDAYNDTPYWIIQVSRDISREHGDTRNPMLSTLIDRITRVSRLYDADIETWMRTTR